MKQYEEHQNRLKDEEHQNRSKDEDHQTKMKRYEEHQNRLKDEEHQKRIKDEEHQKRMKNEERQKTKNSVGYLGRGKHLMDSSPPNLKSVLLMPRPSTPSLHHPST